MIALDPFALLKSIAGAPATFAAVEDDLEALAVAANRKLLTGRGMTIEHLRDLSGAIGPDALGFILGHDSSSDRDIEGLVKKLDKHWPMPAGARIDALRNHLLDLAAGTAEPTGKSQPSAPARRVGAKAKTAEWSKAMSARLRTA